MGRDHISSYGVTAVVIGPRPRHSDKAVARVACTERGAVGRTPAIPPTKVRVATTARAMRNEVAMTTTINLNLRIGHNTFWDSERPTVQVRSGHDEASVSNVTSLLWRGCPTRSQAAWSGRSGLNKRPRKDAVDELSRNGPVASDCYGSARGLVRRSR